MDAASDPGPDAAERDGPDAGGGHRSDAGGGHRSAAGDRDASGSGTANQAQDAPDAEADGADPGSPADGGALLRLARRTAIAAGGLGVAVLLITATGLLWPGWFARPVGLVVGVLSVFGCALAAMVLLRRSGSWTALTARALRESPGIRTVVGEPRPLHGPRPTVVRRRRYAAQVVPIRSATGPWTAGAALIVHGRADDVSLRADDDVVARWINPRGPYLLQRPEDGALFAAERSTLGAW